MSHKIEGSKSVTAALFGNVFVTIIKTIVAVTSGSASMFAESVHSFADMDSVSKDSSGLSYLLVEFYS